MNPWIVGLCILVFPIYLAALSAAVSIGRLWALDIVFSFAQEKIEEEKAHAKKEKDI